MDVLITFLGSSSLEMTVCISLQEILGTEWDLDGMSGRSDVSREGDPIRFVNEERNILRGRKETKRKDRAWRTLDLGPWTLEWLLAIGMFG